MSRNFFHRKKIHGRERGAGVPPAGRPRWSRSSSICVRQNGRSLLNSPHQLAKQPVNLMSIFSPLRAGLALCCVAGLVIAMAVRGAKPKSAVTPPVPPPDQSFVAAGLRVHIDPATGRIAPPPAQAAPDPGVKTKIPSSHQGLVEERGTTAAGGFKIDARGQFQTSVLLRAGPDGKPAMTCVEGASASPQSR